MVHLTVDYLEQQHVQILPWLSLSLDLSPIKHLWDELGLSCQLVPQPRKCWSVESHLNPRVGKHSSGQDTQTCCINVRLVQCHYCCSRWTYTILVKFCKMHFVILAYLVLKKKSSCHLCILGTLFIHKTIISLYTDTQTNN